MAIPCNRQQDHGLLFTDPQTFFDLPMGRVAWLRTDLRQTHDQLWT